MTASEVMKALEAMGNPGTKKTLTLHGAREPFFGVKIGDMKKLVKKIKKDHDLALQLYETGNSDAMYFAGLIADEDQMTKKQLKDWMSKAYWSLLSENIVAQTAADTHHGWDLGLHWITSEDQMIAAGGWSTLSNCLSVWPNEDLDIVKIGALLELVGANIHAAPNRVRYAMNGFVIAAGSYIPELSDKAMQIANEIGKVEVEMGGTACKVPLAVTYIEKVKNAGRLGKKRKMARC